MNEAKKKTKEPSQKRENEEEWKSKKESSRVNRKGLFFSLPANFHARVHLPPPFEGGKKAVCILRMRLSETDLCEWEETWRGWETRGGMDFMPRAEIYGGRYARSKIILISERKGGKVSQASLALLWAGDIKYNHNNKRPTRGRHCFATHTLPLRPPRFLFEALAHPLTTPRPLTFYRLAASPPITHDSYVRVCIVRRIFGYTDVHKACVFVTTHTKKSSFRCW